ncbi:MAG: threonylcarbamoyl-AMP synthase [Bacteroides sp.]|nr:threonylcarbamoyl-AMP synthase [Bacteroidales bacterium]MBD5295904.1 threonylcarbamoyl-AMP synthase [Bacteroides sp.]
MDKIKIWNDNPSESQAQEIADVLASGGLAIIPTDSVYAIVCDALNQKAINELCRLKGLDPEKNNLSIICSDISMAAEYAIIDDAGFNLIKDLTPGPFTFLFRSSRHLPKAFKGRKTVGVRIPDSATARAIATTLGHPILTTSIEFADDDEAREPDLIAERYGNRGIDLIADAGDGDNQYTTIIDCRESESPEIIRQGKGILD